MGSYTVTSISGSRPWPAGEDPPKVIYYDFKVEGEERLVNVGRKPGNELTVGTVLEGTLEPGDRGGLKFVKAAAAGFGGGGGRGRSPEEEARTRRSIQMQHAQKCAVDALRLAAEFGDYKPPAAADVVGQVKAIASGLFQQIEEVAS